MIKNYQEKESLTTPKSAIQNFATIGEIYAVPRTRGGDP